MKCLLLSVEQNFGKLNFASAIMARFCRLRTVWLGFFKSYFLFKGTKNMKNRGGKKEKKGIILLISQHVNNKKGETPYYHVFPIFCHLKFGRHIDGIS